MYGSGHIDDPVLTGDNNTSSGQGSHFDSNRTASNEPLSSSTNPASTSATHGLSEPHSSRMPGTFDDDAATTASVKSGIPGTSQSGNNMDGGLGLGSGSNINKPLPQEPVTSGSSTTAGPHSSTIGNRADPRIDSDRDGSHGGIRSKDTTGNGFGGHSTLGNEGSLPGRSSNTTAGPHSSNLANKVDPRVDSDLDGSRGLGTKMAGTNSGLTGSNVESSSYRNDTMDSYHPGRDTTLGATAVGAGSAMGHHHGDPKSERSFPLSGNSANYSGYSAPGQTGTYAAGAAAPGSSTMNSSSAAAGPHSSNLANKADPRVDSDLDGSRNLGGSNTDHRSNTSGLSSGTGYGAESWSRDHESHGHKHDGGPHLTSGPHITDTANRLDPHVGSGTDDPAATTESSATSGLSSKNTLGGPLSSGTHHGGDGAPAVSAHGSNRDHPASSTTGPAPTTAGPHKSDMLNKMDPRVDSDLSKQGGITGNDVGSSTTGSGPASFATKHPGQYPSSTVGHHTDRDTGVEGATVGGATGNEASRHHGQTTQSSTVPMTGGGSSTAAGPHSSNLANKVDPRVDSDMDGSRGLGSGGTGYGQGPKTDSSDHHRRDAGLAGAGGVGAYEVDKHPGSHAQVAPQERLAGSSHQFNTASTSPQHHMDSSAHQPINTSGTTGPYASSYTGHDAGRDATLGTGAGSGGHLEKEQHKEAKHAEKEAKHAEKETKIHEHHHQSNDGEKKPGLIDRILHRHHDDKSTTNTDRNAPLHDPTTGKGLHQNHRDEEDVAANVGGFDDARHGDHPVGSEMQHGSSSGAHDTSIGTGLTTHDAYGTTERHNKLHKDPPAKVLEQRGLQ
ncbi:MAG: hypothetical protein Q9217_003625 [Psora testacea]